MANIALQRMHQLMNAYEVICWIADNVFDTDSWKTVYEKEFALIEQLEAER